MKMNNLNQKLLAQKSYFKTGNTFEYSWRKEKLKLLKTNIEKMEKKIHQALMQDLGKGDSESYLTETGFSILDIEFALKNLKCWMKPKRVSTPMVHFPVCSYIEYRPFGQVLIIGPWNYPFQLMIAPLVGAIAAGNVAVLKPSELAPNVSKVVKEVIEQTFDESEVMVVEGGIPETQALLAAQFDYIFYTGSTNIGKIIMAEAAKNLTPVTLELGGKSPCILWDLNDLEVAVRRITWGKLVNVGQTCVAPDYLLVPKGMTSKIVEQFKKSLQSFYQNTKTSPDYGRIINDRHFQRLLGLIDRSKVLLGGDNEPSTRYIAPTLMSDDGSGKVMQEEIFGPILPIIEKDSLEDCIDFVRERPHPLALYVFTNNTVVEEKVTRNLTSGGLVINDCLVHLANPHLPFGGVGSSGQGAYHGEFSFRTFSHHRAVMKRYLWLDLLLKYPPYLGKIGLIKRILKIVG
jgi:aldehyde dehydrogenase (NAD+)